MRYRCYRGWVAMFMDVHAEGYRCREPASPFHPCRLLLLPCRPFVHSLRSSQSVDLPVRLNHLSVLLMHLLLWDWTSPPALLSMYYPCLAFSICFLLLPPLWRLISFMCTIQSRILFASEFSSLSLTSRDSLGKQAAGCALLSINSYSKETCSIVGFTDWADPCGFHHFYHYIIDARAQAEYNPCPILFRRSTHSRASLRASITQADDQVAQVVSSFEWKNKLLTTHQERSKRIFYLDNWYVLYRRSAISSVDLIRVHFRFSAFKPAITYGHVYIIALWNQMHSLTREKPMPACKVWTQMCSATARISYVTYASPPTLLLVFLERHSTLRTGSVTYVVFAYHAVYFILAVGTHTRCLKATEPAGPSYVIPAPHAPRTENRGARTLDRPFLTHSLEFRQILSQEMNECIDCVLTSPLIYTRIQAPPPYLPPSTNRGLATDRAEGKRWLCLRHSLYWYNRSGLITRPNQSRGLNSQYICMYP